MDQAMVPDEQREDVLLSELMQGNRGVPLILSELTPEDFTTTPRRECFKVLRGLYERGVEMDFLAVETAIKHKEWYVDLIREYGSLTLYYTLAFSPQIPAYIRYVKECTKRRRLNAIAYDITARIKDGEDADAIYERVERAIFSRDATGMTRTLIKPEEMAEGCYQAAERRRDMDARSKRVLYTSLTKLNANTGGFEKGDLVILSAASGMGKSALAMNIAVDIGITQGRPTLYMNSEMSTEQQQLRYDSLIGGLSHRALRDGQLTDDEMARLKADLDFVRNGKLYTLNMPDMQITSVLSELRRMTAQYKIELAVVDYIGRMDATKNQDLQEWQFMLDSVRRLKTLAQELDITVLMVAQLTSDGGRLAQGSYMKHEADLWLNLKRFDEGEAKKYYPWNCAVEIRKARNAKANIGTLMYFSGDFMIFTDVKSEAERLAGAEQWERQRAAQGL